MRIDQARQDHLAAEIDERPCADRAVFWTSSIGADADQAVALDGQGLADREVAIDRDDLAMMEDQVGLVFGRRGRAERPRDTRITVNQKPSSRANML